MKSTTIKFLRAFQGYFLLVIVPFLVKAMDPFGVFTKNLKTTTMEVVRVSKELIKPSSPTPDHLKTYKLSLLDQFLVPEATPVAFVYQVNNNHENEKEDEDMSMRFSHHQVLKKSLSETLTHFYPMAGRFNDDNALSIDCNDQGVCYIESKVDHTLSDFLNDDITLLNKFVPDEYSIWKQHSSPRSSYDVIMLQVTTFLCGSLIIMITYSHSLVDATTLSSFMKCWAATARNLASDDDDDTSIMGEFLPNFDGPFVFPQSDVYSKDETVSGLFSPFLKTGRHSTKKFVFDAAAIGRLKAKATSSMVPNPTRVEAVSALISKCVKAALMKPMLISISMNLRLKTSPPLPKAAVGNFLWIARAEISLGGDQSAEELQNTASSVRQAITKIDSDFVKKLQGDGGFQNLRKAFKEMMPQGEESSLFDGYEHLLFTSWCNLGVYEVDFGWGNPTQVSWVGLTEPQTVFVNQVKLIDRRSGDGVEAWIRLLERDMQVFQNDQELLQYASLA